jgi:VWFA-related protein
MRFVCAFLLPLALLTAQEQDPTFRTGVNVVVAPTTVTDRDNQFVPGLQPSDFRLTDNGKLQEIQVSTEYTPISLVVAVQANAQSEPALDTVRKIGPMLQGILVGDQGEVAVLGYDHQVQVLQDFTSDSELIEAALKRLKAGSSSAVLNDAVIQASRMLSKRPPQRRRILLVIGEARDHGSASKTRQALTDLQFDNVLFYSVNMSRLKNTLLRKPEAPRPDPYPPGARAPAPHSPNLPSYTSQTYGNAANSGNFIPLFIEIFKAAKGLIVDNPIEVYSEWTGGKEHAFASIRDLERAINDIGAELHSQYVITYAPNNRDEGGFHEIEVAVVNRPRIKARTRPGYWVAAQPNP